MSDLMESIVKEQPGYLGHDHICLNGIGTTISYWKDIESIHNWKKHQQHQEAQKSGKKQWYATYSLRVMKIEKEYSFTS